MLLRRLFLVLIAITIALAGLHLTGYQVLELIIVMVIIDFITLAANVELDKKKPTVDVSGKLENIEKMCEDIRGHVGNPGIEIMLKKQNNNLNYLLDKITKRSLDLELRLNKFGQTLASSVASLNDRVKNIETVNEAPKEITQEEIEEEEKPESFSIGELVYLEDKEKA